MIANIILSIIWVCACVLILVCMFVIWKNENTFKNRAKIIEAIYYFEVDMTQKGDYESLRKVDCLDMEDYNDTLNRFWDWGYTRILPKDKYEIIKPYIQKGK